MNSMSRNIIHWTLKLNKELHLDEYATFYWTKDGPMRDEIVSDARLLSSSFKTPITIYSKDGRCLTIVRAKNVIA